MRREEIFGPPGPFLEVRSTGREEALLGHLPMPAIRPGNGVVSYLRTLFPTRLNPPAVAERRHPLIPLFLLAKPAPTEAELRLVLTSFEDWDGEREVLRCPDAHYNDLFEVVGFVPVPEK